MLASLCRDSIILESAALTSDRRGSAASRARDVPRAPRRPSPPAGLDADVEEAGDGVLEVQAGLPVPRRCRGSRTSTCQARLRKRSSSTTKARLLTSSRSPAVRLERRHQVLDVPGDLGPLRLVIRGPSRLELRVDALPGSGAAPLLVVGVVVADLVVGYRLEVLLPEEVTKSSSRLLALEAPGEGLEEGHQLLLAYALWKEISLTPSRYILKAML